MWCDYLSYHNITPDDRCPIDRSISHSHHCIFTSERVAPIFTLHTPRLWLINCYLGRENSRSSEPHLSVQIEYDYRAVDVWIDGLVQERCNSCALTMKLRLSCINPLTYALYWHIEANTKWEQLGRWHIQMHFLEWKLLYFDWDFIEICSQGFN